MLFSQRIGKQPVPQALQTDGMDDALRNTLWSWVFKWCRVRTYRGSWSEEGTGIRDTYEAIWRDFLKKPVDALYAPERNQGELRNWFFGADWYAVYDFIEFLIAHHLAEYTWVPLSGRPIEELNQFLERERSGFRFVGTHLVEVTNPAEMNEVSLAAGAEDPAGVHIRAAIDELGKRDAADNRKIVQEAIHAVEACCRHITSDPKIEVGPALSLLAEKYGLHGALESGWKRIYGWTSDDGGIRHGLAEGNKPVDRPIAVYMLVASSAFVNYLKSLTRK